MILDIPQPEVLCGLHVIQYLQLTSKPHKYLNNHLQRHKYISLDITNISMVREAYKGKQRNHMLGE